MSDMNIPELRAEVERLTAELADARMWAARALAARDERIEAALHIHEATRHDGVPFCWLCTAGRPCPTVKALRGTA